MMSFNEGTNGVDRIQNPSNQASKHNPFGYRRMVEAYEKEAYQQSLMKMLDKQLPQGFVERTRLNSQLPTVHSVDTGSPSQIEQLEKTLDQFRNFQSIANEIRHTAEQNSWLQHTRTASTTDNIQPWHIEQGREGDGYLSSNETRRPTEAEAHQLEMRQRVKEYQNIASNIISTVEHHNIPRDASIARTTDNILSRQIEPGWTGEKSDRMQSREEKIQYIAEKTQLRKQRLNSGISSAMEQARSNYQPTDDEIIYAVEHHNIPRDVSIARTTDHIPSQQIESESTSEKGERMRSLEEKIQYIKKVKYLLTHEDNQLCVLEKVKEYHGQWHNYYRKYIKTGEDGFSDTGDPETAKVLQLKRHLTGAIRHIFEKYEKDSLTIPEGHEEIVNWLKEEQRITEYIREIDIIIDFERKVKTTFENSLLSSMCEIVQKYDYMWYNEHEKYMKKNSNKKNNTEDRETKNILRLRKQLNDTIPALAARINEAGIYVNEWWQKQIHKSQKKQREGRQ